MFSCKLLNKAKNLFLTKLNFTEKKKTNINKQTLNLLETVTNTNTKTSKKKKQSDNIVKQNQKLDNLE